MNSLPPAIESLRTVIGAEASALGRNDTATWLMAKTNMDWDGLAKLNRPREQSYDRSALGTEPATKSARGTKRSSDEILDIGCDAPFDEAFAPCKHGAIVNVETQAPLHLVQASGPGITRNESYMYPSPPSLSVGAGGGGVIGGRLVSVFAQAHRQSPAHAHPAEYACIDEGQTESADVPTKKAKKAKKDPNAPRKSLTAWMLFRTATTPYLKAENPGDWCNWR